MVRLEKNAFSPRHVRSPSFRTRRVALRQKKYLLKRRNSVKSKKGVLKLTAAQKAKQKMKTNAAKVVFRGLQSHKDKQMTYALEYAQSKLKLGCLRPKGSFVALRKQLSATERKRKPQPGERCVAIAQGHVVKKFVTAEWEPGTFQRWLHSNGDATKRYAVIRRTDARMSADLRCNPYMCVLATDVYAYPDSFPSEFAKRFDPVSTAGVYVVVNADGAAYVGWSKNIEKRVKEHNGLLPGGAKATLLRGRGPWWRVQPLTDNEPLETDAQRENRELRLQKDSRGAKIVWGGSECQRVKPAYSQ